MTVETPRRPAGAPDRKLAGSCPGRWCKCLACADYRAAAGQAPLAIWIGRHRFPSYPSTGGRDDGNP